MAVLADGRLGSDGRPEQSFRQLRRREDSVCHRPLSQRGESALRRDEQTARRPRLSRRRLFDRRHGRLSVDRAMGAARSETFRFSEPVPLVRGDQSAAGGGQGLRMDAEDQSRARRHPHRRGARHPVRSDRAVRDRCGHGGAAVTKRADQSVRHAKGRNTMRYRFALAAALTALSAFAATPSARADDYPTRPVTLVVPYTPGGSTEILARIIGQQLGARLGQAVVVEMKPGAGTVIGATAVAQARADGYTLLMATPTPLAINVTVHKTLPYDPAKDFMPLAMVASAPFLFLVNPSLPVHSVKELIAYAKANPGQLSYGSGGVGAPHHLYMELFKSMTGTQMTHVPYKGSLPALNDVVGGHIQLMFCDIPPAAGMIAAGKVRVLGVSTGERVPSSPAVPTVAEAGVPGFSVAGWFMIVAPAQTPPAIVDKLHKTLIAVMNEPDVKARIAQLSLVALPTPSVADMQAYVKSEIARWGKIVQQAGIAGTE